MENKLIANSKETISSLELVKQINIFRQQEGNRAELQHYDLLKIIRDEFEEEIGLGKISVSSYKNSQNKEQPMYNLTYNQAKQILVRESKFVRKAVIQYIEKLENEIKKVSAKPTIDKDKRLEIMEKNANVRMAKMLKSLIPFSKSERYKEILVSEATKVLTGRELIPPPEVEAKTITATQIAERLGVSANKIGKIANANNLKTEKFGYWVHEKASHCNKEIPNFRYFESTIEEFKKYI